MADEKDEYELIPMSPLRRLEKRMERIEEGKGVDTGEFFSQLVEIVKMNQQLVDELVKADDSLRIEIARLPAKLDEVVDNLNELIAFIKAAGTEDATQAVKGTDLGPLLNKMDSLIEINKRIVDSNEVMMSSMEKMKMRPRPMGKPQLRPLPQLRRRVE